MTYSDPNQLHMDSCVVCGALFGQPVQSGSKKIYCTKKCCDRARARRHRLRVAGRLPIEADTAQVFKFSYMYARHKKNASKRGLLWAIPKPDWIRWNEETPQVCHYCDMTPETQAAMTSYMIDYRRKYGVTRWMSRCPQETLRLTLDRKDNAAGYTLDNIVRACWFCNNLKGALISYEYMKEIAPRAMAEYQAVLCESE